MRNRDLSGVAAIEKGLDSIWVRQHRVWLGPALIGVQRAGGDTVEGRFGGEARQEIGGDDRLVRPHDLLVARIEGRADLLLVWRGSGAEHMIDAGVVAKLEEVLDLRD